MPEVLLYIFQSAILLVILIWMIYMRRPKSRKEEDKNKLCESKKCVRCLDKNEFISRSIAKLEELQEEDKTASSIGRILSYIRASGDGSFVSKYGQKPTKFYYPNLSSLPIYVESPNEQLDGDLFILQKNHDLIRAEINSLMIHFELNRKYFQENTIPKGKWNLLYLFNQGAKMNDNCALMPQTAAIIESLENFMQGCVFGNAAISLLWPQSSIEAHHGATNVRLRCHLGLNVPTGCRLEAGGMEAIWQEGKCLLMDDSYLHSVTYEGDSQRSGVRIVLIVDLWHWQVPLEERNILKQLR